MDAINTLAAAQPTNRLKAELKKYLVPSLLILDELGYLPIDKLGAVPSFFRSSASATEEA